MLVMQKNMSAFNICTITKMKIVKLENGYMLKSVKYENTQS